MRVTAVVALLIATGTVAACASPAGPSIGRQETASGQTRRDAFEAAMSRLDRAERDGRLREAMWWLQVADAVADDPARLRPARARVDAKMASAVDALVAEGDLARRRRATAQASAAYQKALELQPQNTRARVALREMETAAMFEAIARGGGGGPPPPARAGGAN